jgi:allophanate hydrolase
VAARIDAIGELASSHPESVDPSVARILAGAATLTAADVYRAESQLAVLRRSAERAWAGTDAILVPTTPGPATVDEVDADPFGRNTRLGRYTNGVNLLDLCAIAVPGADRADGWPTGISVLGPAWSDHAVAALAAHLVGEELSPAGPGAGFDLVVVGAHLSGMPRNIEVTDLGGVLVRTTATAPVYRLYAIAGTTPPRPGLVHVGPGGAAIAAEVWRLPVAAVGTFVAGIPAPLGIGTVELADGSRCQGFICEPRALDGADDVTSFGGWRAYIASTKP